MRMFDNRVLRRIFGPKRDEVRWEWRKLHNEELNDLYSSPNIVRVIKSRRMRWAGMQHVWGKGDVYIGFWWGNLGERAIWKTQTQMGECNIKMDFRKWDGDMEWIDLAQDRNMWRALVNAVLNLRGT